MQTMPSTYHQCVNFPYNGVEVSISTYTSYSCNILRQFVDSMVPHNREASKDQKDKSANATPFRNFDKIVEDK